VVNVPSEEDEDQRQLHRELTTTKRDRTRLTNRIKALLFAHGICLKDLGNLPERLSQLRLWNGKPLPEGLRRRMEREWAKVVQLTQQVAELEKERRRRMRIAGDKASRCARQLMRLRGIGEAAGWLFSTEFFAWREFRNRREVGSLAGLTPTPYQSGNESHEQGMSKAGNRWVRGMVIEIAWGWLQHQPGSELSRWYERRFAHGSSRLRRIGIVAVARKLMIELWKYLQTGALPAGAMLKA
jgi:transposase